MKARIAPKIIVWLDVDGVLVDFYRLTNRKLRKKGYRIPLDYVPQEYSYGEIITKAEFKDIFQSLGENWPQYARVHPLARSFCENVRKLGAQINIVSSLWGHQGPERLKNLRKAKIPFDSAYFTQGRNKSDFINNLLWLYPGAKHIFVDDYAKNIIDFMARGPSESWAVTLNIAYNDKWGKELAKWGNRIILAHNIQSLYINTELLIQQLKEGKNVRTKIRSR